MVEIVVVVVAWAIAWALAGIPTRPLTDWEKYQFMGTPETCDWCGERLTFHRGGGWVTVFCVERGHSYFRMDEREMGDG